MKYCLWRIRFMADALFLFGDKTGYLIGYISGYLMGYLIGDLTGDLGENLMSLLSNLLELNSGVQLRFYFLQLRF